MQKKKQDVETLQKDEDSKCTFRPAISETSLLLAQSKKSMKTSKESSKIMQDSVEVGDDTVTYVDTSKIFDDEVLSKEKTLQKKRLEKNLVKLTELENAKPQTDQTSHSSNKHSKVKDVPVSSRLYQPGKGRRQEAKFNKKGSTAVVVETMQNFYSSHKNVKERGLDYGSHNTLKPGTAHDSIQAYFSTAYHTAQ